MNDKIMLRRLVAVYKSLHHRRDVASFDDLDKLRDSGCFVYGKCNFDTDGFGEWFIVHRRIADVNEIVTSHGESLAMLLSFIAFMGCEAGVDLSVILGEDEATGTARAAGGPVASFPC